MRSRVALIYPSPKLALSGCNPPYALLGLATVLVDQGYDARVFDIDAYGGRVQALVEDIKRFDPLVTGISILAHTYDAVEAVRGALEAADTGGTLVLGGPEVTADPFNVLGEFPAVPYAIAGDGEEALADLVESVEEELDPSEIPGLVYREGDNVLHNPHATVDVTNLPFPDRTLLGDAYQRELYWRMGHRGATDILLSSRGCPYQCTFCSEIRERAVQRPADQVHREIEHILSLGIRNIHFMDDLLVSSERRIREIFDPIDTAGVAFKVRARADRIDADVVAYLASKGVEEITCGYESGSDRMLEIMNKGITAEQNLRAIQTIKKQGLRAFADMVFLVPGETMETAQQTFEFLRRARPSYVNWDYFVPFANAPLTQALRRRGHIEGQFGIGKRPTVHHENLTEPQRRELVTAIGVQMRRLNSHPRHVLLPNLRDVIATSGLRRYKHLLHYARLYWSAKGEPHSRQELEE